MGNNNNNRGFLVLKKLVLVAVLTAFLGGCAVAPAPISPKKFDTAEQSTAVMNVSVVSPEGLYIWNRPTFSDDCQLVYSAKQWEQGQLGNSVSIWRSPCDGGPATKLIAAGQDELLSTAAADPKADRIYFMLSCQLFSASKSGGGGRTKLAGSGACDYAPSPVLDGREILFSSCSSGKDCYWKDTNYIWRMNADGRNMIQLRQGREPRMSPDGKFITFSYGGDIWVMTRDGADVTNLTSDGRYFDSGPSFSPDGRRIVFSRTPTGGQSDIWMVNTDGGDLVQLTMNPASDLAAYWAADNYIYFVSNRGELVNKKYSNRLWRMKLR